MRIFLIIIGGLAVSNIIRFFMLNFKAPVVVIASLFGLFLAFNLISSRRSAGKTILLLNKQKHDWGKVIDDTGLIGFVWITVTLVIIQFALVIKKVLLDPIDMNYLLGAIPVIIFLVFIIVIKLGKNRITEGGFLTKQSYLVRWDRIDEWYWKDCDSSILIIKARRQFNYLHRKHNNNLIILEWEIPSESKQFTDEILSKYLPGKCVVVH